MRVGLDLRRLRRGMHVLVVGSVVGAALALLPSPERVWAGVPPGFEDQPVTSVRQPVALATMPDGRLLVTSKTGVLHVIKDGELLGEPALDLSRVTCSDSERGLVGAAVDPRFESNGYVYVYYTFDKHQGCLDSAEGMPVNRVSRFDMSGDLVDPASEKVLIDGIPSPPPGAHNGGDLQFGPDGYLYVSVGDGGCNYRHLSRCQNHNDAARDRHVLLGKVLRITRDGGIPPDNPFTGESSARCAPTGRTQRGYDCRETYATGLRNPFRMAFDPDAAGTRLHVNDVGGGKWEEIDRGRPGADYGWNVREGPCALGSTTDCGAPPRGMTNPIHHYSHSTGCSSVTGGAFVPDGAWAAGLDQAYLVGDFVCGKIFTLTRRSDGSYRRAGFATGLGPGPVAMTFHPDASGQGLYYTTYANGGQVRRIAYTAGDRPVASVAGRPNYSPTLTVDLDASDSHDPDGETPLTYLWDFGDGQSAETTSPTLSHTYPSAGRRTVTVQVRDTGGSLSAPATVDVFPGNTPPEPMIASPALGDRFEVGERLVLEGSASDAEDGGALSTGALRWEVLRHHDGSHAHPWFSGTGSGLEIGGPPPEDIRSTNPDRNYLEVRLTVTDSEGLSRTVARNVRPATVGMRFESRPTGLRLEVNGRAFRTPKTFTSWPGYRLNLDAPAQRHDGRRWVFDSWSDGGARAHTVVTPRTSTTLRATFRRR